MSETGRGAPPKERRAAKKPKPAPKPSEQTASVVAQPAAETSQSVPAVNPEGQKPVDADVEAFLKLSPVEQTARRIGVAREEVQKAIDGKTLSEAEQKVFESGLAYNGGPVTPESSAALGSLTESLGFLALRGNEDARDTLAGINQHLRVQVGQGENAQILTVEQWRAKTPEERAAAGEVLYGFQFPQEQQGSSPEAGPADNSAQGAQASTENGAEVVAIKEGELFQSNAARIELQIEARKKQRKERNIADERLLGLLRLADISEGEVGVLIRAEAVRALQGRGVEIDPAITASHKDSFFTASERFENFLIDNGYSATDAEQIKTLAQNEGLSHIVASGGLTQLNEQGKEGLGRLVFGDVKDDDVAEGLKGVLVDKSLLEKYGPRAKKGTLLFMVLMALGSAAIVKDAAGMGPRR